ncbi:MAG: UvrD-helicase domain-containing protein, partial [Candidatus Gastranaerophilales bacterium]|nr:UvrD-helicase domain-containing protein [Candidatus Gastranaerophilales bacterium]
MYLQGPLKSGKTSFLIDKFINLIKNGAKTSQILIVCANSHKKRLFIDAVKGILAKDNIKGFGEFPVYTFNGIVYNSVLKNWSLIEDIICKTDEASVILPDMSGLETTEYILKHCIGDEDFSDYKSKINLLHQLLRRYRLIYENSLDEIEIDKKSEFLGQTFAQDSKNSLKRLKEKTSRIRTFDYLKQISMFLYLQKNNKIKDFDKIKYLLADDIDEYNYPAQIFIKNLAQKTEEFYFAADAQGGARRGYLCAYPEGWENIKKEIDSPIKEFSCAKPSFNNAIRLFDNITSEKNSKIDNLELFESKTKIEMLDCATNQIDFLLKNGANPDEIMILAPIIDDVAKYGLVQFFEKENIKYQFLSGTKRLLDNKIVYNCLIISQLINYEWQLYPTKFELRMFLSDLIGLSIKSCKKIIDYYGKNKKLPEKTDLQDFENENYNKLLAVIEKAKNEENLYNQIILVFKSLVLQNLTDEIRLDDLNTALKSLNSFYKINEKLKLNKTLKQLEKEWLIQVKITVVSDNPPVAPEVEENSIIITTPQKAVDCEFEKKYQIWLDISDNNWIKDDEGPLYNAWVFQKNWDLNKEYTPELHKKLTMKKTAHLLRKLVICADKEILAFSSQLSIDGNSNTEGLIPFINPESINKKKPSKKITPREDQKPVLTYKSGSMAIPAVPGAGKTTIIQALIIEMIENGIKPEEILVLTYMESAAKNFQDRIKKNCRNLVQTPHISTIHGLALKIIQDENNYTKIGLDSDFTICDDTQKPRIISEICKSNLPVGENEKDWIETNTRGLSKAKLEQIPPEQIKIYLKTSQNQRLEEFLPVYKDYLKIL